MTKRFDITRRTALAGMAAGAGVLAAPALIRRAYAADEIRVGAQVPITGPLSLSGQQYYNSLQMAQDDINKAGGVAGKKLKVVFEDTQASNNVAVNAFVKLMRDIDPPFVFLSSYSTQNLATEPEVTKAGVPCVYSGGADAVHERGNDWMFRIRPNDAIQAKAMATYVIEDLKAKKPGFMYVQNDFGQGGMLSAKKLFEEAGMTAAAVEAHAFTDNDMSAQILSMKNSGADVVVVFAYGKDGALIVKQFDQLGVDLPIVISSGVMIPSSIDLITAKELRNVTGVMDSYLAAERGPKVADYVKRFQERFNLAPDPFGSCYYDAAFMLKGAIEAAGTDRAGIRDYFDKVKGYDGITQTFTTDAVNNMAHSVAIVGFDPGTKNYHFRRNVTVDLAT